MRFCNKNGCCILKHKCSEKAQCSRVIKPTHNFKHVTFSWKISFYTKSNKSLNYSNFHKQFWGRKVLLLTYSRPFLNQFIFLLLKLNCQKLLLILHHSWCSNTRMGIRKNLLTSSWCVYHKAAAELCGMKARNSY